MPKSFALLTMPILKCSGFGRRQVAIETEIQHLEVENLTPLRKPSELKETIELTSHAEVEILKTIKKNEH